VPALFAACARGRNPDRPRPAPWARPGPRLRVPRLVELLDAKDTRGSGLRGRGPRSIRESSPARPSRGLLECLKDPDIFLRLAVGRSAGPRSTWSRNRSFQRSWRCSRNGVRGKFIDAIGKFGPAAREAVPALIEQLQGEPSSQRKRDRFCPGQYRSRGQGSGAGPDPRASKGARGTRGSAPQPTPLGRNRFLRRPRRCRRCARSSERVDTDSEMSAAKALGGDRAGSSRGCGPR